MPSKIECWVCDICYEHHQHEYQAKQCEENCKNKLEDKNIELIIIEDIRSNYLRRDVKFKSDGKMKEKINTTIFPDLLTAKENIPNLDKDYILSTLPLINWDE